MATIQETQENIKSTVLDMLNYVKDFIIPSLSGKIEQYWCDIAAGVVNVADSLEIAERFGARSFKYWDRIFDKDEDFIFSNWEIFFGPACTRYTAPLTEAFLTPGLISQEIRDKLWQFIHSMIKNFILFVHWKRVPKEVDGVVKYTGKYFSTGEFNMKVKKEMEKWQI
jgi:hypothetical protein